VEIGLKTGQSQKTVTAYNHLSSFMIAISARFHLLQPQWCKCSSSSARHVARV